MKEVANKIEADWYRSERLATIPRTPAEVHDQLCSLVELIDSVTREFE